MMENAQHLLPENAPQPGTYRHYKGPLYKVLGMVRHSETEEWMVVYQALYGEQGFWVRPLSIWLDPVKTPHQTDESNSTCTDGTTRSRERFEFVVSSEQSLTQLVNQTLFTQT